MVSIEKRLQVKSDAIETELLLLISDGMAYSDAYQYGTAREMEQAYNSMNKRKEKIMVMVKKMQTMITEV